ncbi:MAG: response regulator [Anaerolineae bacterium]|nr:response regulator [Anaerolineae bacterium]
MSSRNSNQNSASADWAEGPAPGVDDDPVDDQLERVAALHDRSLPSVPLKAETGVMEIVMRSGDAAEDDNAQDALRTTAETRAVSELQSEPRPPIVLIVEDAFELAEILQITLRRLKLVTAHESFGAGALERYKELKPDMVLLDISLPDMAGWQVLEHIKGESRASGIAMPIVIVITAMGDPANRLIGKLQGVYRYLIKPFTPREVEQVVREALNTRSV